MMISVKSAVIIMAVAAILFSLIPSIGSQIEVSTISTGMINTVDVYFNSDGTDATLFKVGIYTTDGNRIAITNDGNVNGDTWCTARFSSPVIVDNGESYIFMVSANGNYSIDGDEIPGYTSENLTSYGAFPLTLANPMDGDDLSIRTHFG